LRYETSSGTVVAGNGVLQQNSQIVAASRGGGTARLGQAGETVTAGETVLALDRFHGKIVSATLGTDGLGLGSARHRALGHDWILAHQRGSSGFARLATHDVVYCFGVNGFVLD
jgi:hypothetical protein